MKKKKLMISFTKIILYFKLHIKKDKFLSTLKILLLVYPLTFHNFFFNF